MKSRQQTVKKSSFKQEDSSFFYFEKSNYQWMAIGVGVIILGFLLMLGSDANTTSDGNFDPNYWNEGIYSFRRIRFAPFVVLVGFAMEIYAIMKPSKSQQK